MYGRRRVHAAPSQHLVGWYEDCCIVYMKHRYEIQNIIRTLIKSEFYFDLSLQERHDFIKDILRKLPASIRAPRFFAKKRPVFRGEG